MSFGPVFSGAQYILTKNSKGISTSKTDKKLLQYIIYPIMLFNIMLFAAIVGVIIFGV